MRFRSIDEVKCIVPLGDIIVKNVYIGAMIAIENCISIEALAILAILFTNSKN